MRRVAVTTVALALGLSALAVRADRDQDRAWGAVQRGEILPLSEVLTRVGRDFPGDVLEVELEDEEGGRAYEVKVLTPGGERLELRYDARTGELLTRRGHARRGGGQ